MKYSEVKKLGGKPRYQWEYRQHRMFESYLNQPYTTKQPPAVKGAYTSWCMRHRRFTGWGNENRHQRFCDLLEKRYPELYFPF